MHRFKFPHARWRRAAFCFAVAAFLTFIINFAFILWATINRGSDLEDGIGTVFQGSSCAQTKAFNTGIHIIINVLSTVLLAGSNYCMQCLMAPTRSEVNAAHAKQKWLDIGIPSVRNFWSIPKTKKAIWFLLSASSFPLHLLYNSVIFTSTSVNTYSVYQVTEEFVTQKDPTLISGYSDLRDVHLAVYENITLHKDHHIQLLQNKDCLRYYGAAFQSSRGNLLLITANAELSEPEGGPQNFEVGGRTVSQPFDWICPIGSLERVCDDELPRIRGNPDDWRPYGSKIQRCYSQKTTEHCKLLYSHTLCWVVTVLNLLKGILMLFVAFSATETPILTIGDAIKSFMQEKDKTTAGMSLKSRQDFSKKDWGTAPRQFGNGRRRKFVASSLSRWLTCVILYVYTLVICLCLLGFGLNIMDGNKDISQLGFGAPHSKTVLDIGIMGQGSKFLLLNVMLANTPQVIMSLLYFNYNALYTSISLVTEWDRFGHDRKGLRVSAEPRTDQRQTYFLQLPYRYSLPLVVFSGILHWLISQTIFLVNLEVYGPSGDNAMEIIPLRDYRGEPTTFTTCGWSPIGVVYVVAAGFCMLSFLILSGWRRLKFGILPVAGSCSAAISAACHSIDNEPYAWEKGLQWGVVQAPVNGPGKCSFSSMKVETPQKGQPYA